MHALNKFTQLSLLAFMTLCCSEKVIDEKPDINQIEVSESIVEKTEVDNNYNSSEKNFKIIKIDSLSDLYLIYAFKQGNVFAKYYKIISNKSDSINNRWSKIEVDNYYKFDLEIMASQRGVFEHVSEIAFDDDGPFIKFEGDSITTIYSSPNIRGLYITPEIH